MSALGHPPRPASPPSSLTADHANVLLDALDHIRILLRRGVQPWGDYAGTGPADPLTTEAGYRDLIDTASAVLTALLEAHPEAVLVPIDDVPGEYAPVRVNLGDTELTDPHATAPTAEVPEAGR